MLNKYSNAEKAYGNSFDDFQNETHYLTTMSSQNPPITGKRTYKFVVFNKIL